MLKGGNHQATPLLTHGFLVGVELEEGVQIDPIMNRLADSVSWIEGVGRVEIEHIGELDINKSLEEEVLDAMVTEVKEVQES